MLISGFNLAGSKIKVRQNSIITNDMRLSAPENLAKTRINEQLPVA